MGTSLDLLPTCQKLHHFRIGYMGQEAAIGVPRWPCLRKTAILQSCPQWHSKSTGFSGCAGSYSE